ncbi:MAG TPA: hypothetical protein VL349_14795 [Terriglobales bacterium]|nr:hypothetical protein [Terriglobales bacterium]
MLKSVGESLNSLVLGDREKPLRDLEHIQIAFYELDIGADLPT